jgi:arginine/lysine/ornithine decarboxylase
MGRVAWCIDSFSQLVGCWQGETAFEEEAVMQAMARVAEDIEAAATVSHHHHLIAISRRHRYRHAGLRRLCHHHHHHDHAARDADALDTGSSWSRTDPEA